MTTALEQFIIEMPKAELHLHLEGAIQPATVLLLAERNRVTLPFTTEAELERFFQIRDFPHFIEVFAVVSKCLLTPDDFTLVVNELGADAARQHIRYLEIHFNPEPHVRRRGLRFDELLAGMNRGRAEVRDRWDVELRWIADGVRDAESGPASVATTVDWITALHPSAGVVALGLGGGEAGYPPNLFIDSFARARAAGLHVVAHAGEATGPETIRDSLDLLKAERIGHGIRAIDEPILVARLARERIPLEICPTSNLRTGVVKSLADHPLRRLDEAGVIVTVNSDDPPFFGTTLTDEYRLLATSFGYGIDDIERIALNAVHVSFLPDVEKRAMVDDFRAAYAGLRARHGLAATAWARADS
ncbi:MAG: adenosine deaminase [Chloroflexota bacterium]|nr:adenosine deaminase [Chloroflexota bacterium]